MRTGKRFAQMLMALALLVATASPAMAAGKSLVVGLASDALFMDPHMQNETITNAITSHFYESLTFQTPDGSIVPMLAESWEISPDQLTWTFHLRKDVKFSDGSPFTAEDVMFNLERIKTKTIRDRAVTIKSMEAVDAHTLKITTNAPDGVLPDNLAEVRLMSKAYTTKVGDEEVNLKPMGTGPYILKEWIKEDHITMEPNPLYWGKKPSISNVRFRPITNAATRTAALLTGEVDIAEDIPVRDVERVKRTKGIDVLAVPGRRLIYMHIDANREPTPAIAGDKNPMKDLRVRQAMSLGIDRETIVRVTLNNSGYPTGQLLLEGKRGFVPGRGVPEYNPEKAQALLAEAGYPKGFTLTFDAPNGRYINDAQVAQAIASQWAKIGINVDLRLHPKSVFFDFVRPGDKSSLVMTGWAEEVDSGKMSNVLFYSRGKIAGKGNSNRGHYSNPEFDSLIDQADATADIAKRGELLEKASLAILDDVGVIPLYFNQDLYGKKANVDFTPRANKNIMAHEIDIK